MQVQHCCIRYLQPTGCPETPMITSPKHVHRFHRRHDRYPDIRCYCHTAPSQRAYQVMTAPCWFIDWSVRTLMPTAPQHLWSSQVTDHGHVHGLYSYAFLIPNTIPSILHHTIVLALTDFTFGRSSEGDVCIMIHITPSHCKQLCKKTPSLMGW